MPAPTYESRKAVYRRLWAQMAYDAGREAGFQKVAARIIANKARYQSVAAKTGCPWFLIGILHNMESGGRFDRHLHNGDPLTARTRQVPAGRPKTGNPPFTWEESAVDALLMKGTNKIAAWPLERIGYFSEAYNGWGYLNKPDPSPYLWAGTNINDGRGKYVADHVYDANAPSEGQNGVMGTLRALMEADPSIRPGYDGDAPKPPPVAAPAGAGVGAAGAAVAAHEAGLSPWQVAAVFAVVLVVGVGIVVWRRRK